MLMLKAPNVPQMRKIRFNCEYFLPQVGLLRINSALEKVQIEIEQKIFLFQRTFDGNECKS